MRVLLFIPFVFSLAFSQSSYALKSVYTYQLARFTNWSELECESRRKTFNIGVYADNEQYKYFTAMAGKQINSKRVSLTRIDNIEDIKGCDIHLLFIGKDKEEFLPALKDFPIMTVSDIDNFTQKGGIVWLNFNNKGPKIYINMHNAKKRKIKFSSRLLEIAVLHNGDHR